MERIWKEVIMEYYVTRKQQNPNYQNVYFSPIIFFTYTTNPPTQQTDVCNRTVKEVTKLVA